MKASNIDKNSTKKDYRCCFILLQVCLWICLAAIFFLFEMEIKLSSIQTKLMIFIGVISAIIYIFYICHNFDSSEWESLKNIRTLNEIKQILRQNFCNPIKIFFSAECFHFEYRYVNGNSDRRKVNVHEEKEEFRYYSGRDISGIFKFDSDKVNRSFIKSMVKLHLKIEFEFADQMSQLDYNMKKDFFIARNRPRDMYMNFLEDKTINGFEEFNLIHLGEHKPYTMSKCLFIIFLIFGIIEIYKIYLNLQWAEQEFTVRKVISTRFDLNMHEFANKYSKDIPKIIIQGNEFPIHNSNYIKEKIYGSPTDEELNRAHSMNQLYEKKLSTYNINLGDNIQQIENNHKISNNYGNYDKNTSQMQLQNIGHSINDFNISQYQLSQQTNISNVNSNNNMRQKTLNVDTLLQISNKDSNSQRELGKKLI